MGLRLVAASVTIALLLLARGTAASAEWHDPAGDVTLPNADLLGGSATVADGIVDLRVQFAERPYPQNNTHHVSWCIDTEMDGGDEGACGYGDLIGAEEGFTLFGGLDALTTCDFSFNGALTGLDPLEHVWYEPTTRTLRVTFPLPLLEDDGLFAYIVVSAFGGSFGANDHSPDAYGFSRSGGSYVSEPGLLPFGGSLICSGPDVNPPISNPPSTTDPPKIPVLVTQTLGLWPAIAIIVIAIAVLSSFVGGIVFWRRRRRGEST